MDDEKPLDLRDKLAMEILNGILSNGSAKSAYNVEDIIIYSGLKDQTVREAALVRMEQIIRYCYKVADIIRKVRLTAFE